MQGIVLRETAARTGSLVTAPLAVQSPGVGGATSSPKPFLSAAGAGTGKRPPAPSCSTVLFENTVNAKCIFLVLSKGYSCR